MFTQHKSPLNENIIYYNNVIKTYTKIVNFADINRRKKENPVKFLAEKREIKEQQRLQRLRNKFPSQEEFYIYIVDNALKPFNKK